MSDARPGAERLRGFQRLRFEAFQAFEAGRYADVLPIALEAAAGYPDKGEVPFWIACVHCDQGRLADAVETLRAGLDRGMWWPDDWLLEDGDLAPLRGGAELAEIVAHSAHNRRAGGKTGGRGAATRQDDGAAPRAVVLALHGWGQEAAEFAAEWTDVVAAGIAVVAPESTEERRPGFFVWDDRVAARSAVASQYEESRERISLPDVPLVLAGFSQGGGLAIDLAIDEAPAPSAGFLALSAGLEDLEAPPDAVRLCRAAARGVRGRLVAGGADVALPSARDLVAAAGSAGLPCPLAVLPGAGHRMPDPGSGLLLAEIEALLG